MYRFNLHPPSAGLSNVRTQFDTSGRNLFSLLLSIHLHDTVLFIYSLINHNHNHKSLFTYNMTSSEQLKCLLFIQICHSHLTNLFIFVLFCVLLMYYLCVMMCVCCILIKITFLLTY